MSRIVVLGAGVAGHTAASFLRSWLGRDDSVVVVSPKLLTMLRILWRNHHVH